MNKPSEPFTKTVRDPQTGALVIVHGYGALRGRLPIRDDLDLTKPILAQIEDLDRLGKT